MTAHFDKAGLDENGLYYAPIDRARRGHSDEVWLRAREAYEGGLSVQTACERAGVSRSALFERARKEGWRRPAPRGWVTDEELAEAAAAPPLTPQQAAEEPGSRPAWPCAWAASPRPPPGPACTASTARS
ncbi:MAG TPA: hypothetical protein VF559_12060 [Caulobacteraceae bacterium]|jgi:hypothetical protein